MCSRYGVVVVTSLGSCCLNCREAIAIGSRWSFFVDVTSVGGMDMEVMQGNSNRPTAPSQPRERRFVGLWSSFNNEVISEQAVLTL